MKTTAIAMICHAVNTAYCLSLGDESHLSWEESPESIRKGIEFGVQLRLDKPGITAEQLHQSWLDDKTKQGWVYGENKDPQAKTHPCILPYDELPQEQKSKDFIFGAIVDAVKGLPDTEEHHALLTKLMTVQADANRQLQAPRTTSQTSAPANAGNVLIVYNGFKEQVIDLIYGSNVSFTKGEPKYVPRWLAKNLLTHAEYSEVIPESQEVGVNTADNTDSADELSQETKEQLEKARLEKAKLDEQAELIVQMKQNIQQMNDKDVLVEFGMRTFNQKLSKSQSVETMQNKLCEMIDHQGVPEA